MFVPVVDRNRKPLMPTTSARARRWIKSGEATPFWDRGIFGVRLNRDPSGCQVQDIAVVSRNVQGSVAGVDRPEQPPKILPHRPWIVGIVVLVGFMNGLGGQESPVFAECTEQDAVEELLRAGQHLVRAGGRIGPAQMLKGIFPHAGIANVEFLGQLAADLLRGTEQFVQVAPARGRDDPPGTEEEDEPPELAFFVDNGVSVKPLVGVLVRSLVVKVVCRIDVTMIQSHGRLMA